MNMTQKRHEVEMLLRCVLLPNKKGLLMSDLEHEYRGMTGSRIPYKSLGYNSLLSMVKDMRDVARLQMLPSGHLLVRAAADESTQHIAEMVNCQKDNMEGYNQHTGKVLAGQLSNTKVHQDRLPDNGQRNTFLGYQYIIFKP